MPKYIGYNGKKPKPKKVKPKRAKPQKPSTGKGGKK